MNETKDRPSITERYSNATNASNLVVVAEKSGQGDVLIASGLAAATNAYRLAAKEGRTSSALGSSLLRLASEWDAAEKPRAVTAMNLAKIAEALERQVGRDSVNEEDRRTARHEAAKWLEHEQKILMGKLKTLPSARAQVAAWAETRGFKHSPELAAKVLLWWLDPNCKQCHGTKWETIKDTNRQSNRVCPTCRGSGERKTGAGFEVPILLGYLDSCVTSAQDQMKKRLKNYN